MPLTKKQKADVISEIETRLKAQESTVFVDFQGLSHQDMEKMKREFRAQGVAMKVYRKSLIARALKAAGIEVKVDEFQGSVALVTSNDDALAAAKQTSLATRKFKALKMLGGLFEDKFVTLAEVTLLASVPSRPELLGMLANVLQAPVRGLAVSFNEIITGFARVLKAKSEKAV